MTARQLRRMFSNSPQAEMWLAADTPEALHGLLVFLGLANGEGAVPGVSYVEQPAGSTYERLPNGGSETLNSEPWGAVLVAEPLYSDEDFWAVLDDKKATAQVVAKPSANGNADSQWWQWSVTGGTGRMLKEGGGGDAWPVRRRMTWAT